MPIREDKNFVCFLDIEIYSDWGSHTWAQENFLVHGYDDVMWTSNVDSAVEYLRSDLLRIMPNAKQCVHPTNGGLALRACVNANCGWVGKESACLTWKHAGDERMCPYCHDNTESIPLSAISG